MKKIFTMCLCLLILSGCGKNEKHTAEYFQYFDTLSEITYYCDDEKTEEIRQAIDFTLKDYHQLCDNYNEYKGVVNVKTINSLPSKTLQIDKKLADILQFAYDNYSWVDGKVNIASGSVLSLWHDARSSGNSLPKETLIKKALEHIDIENMVLYNNSVTLTDPFMSLDLGAIAKGYAAQEVVNAMKEAGAKSGIVNMGGNVACFGNPPNRDYFVAGIQDPNGNGIAAKVKLKDAALVTSGDYQRFYTVNGIKYHHIIDLKNGYPLNLYKSVSVYHENSAIADLLSTALFLSTEEEGRKIAEQYNAQVFWIYQDGHTVYTENFPIMN